MFGRHHRHDSNHPDGSNTIKEGEEKKKIIYNIYNSDGDQKNPEQKRDWFFCRENKGDVKTVWGLGGRVIKLSKCQSQQTVRVVTRMVHLY